MIHTRHSNIFNIPDYFRVGIVGAGGLGATTALAFAKMGVRFMTVWDDDVVSQENIATQLHKWADVDEPKIHGLQHTLELFSDDILFRGVQARIDESSQFLNHYHLLVSAVDSITARKHIWNAIYAGEKPDFYLDLRMSALEYQHFLVDMQDRHPSIHLYAEMLESINEEDVLEVACTERATFFTSMAAAGHAGKVLKDIVRHEAMPHRLIHYIDNEHIRYFNM